ncbi:hypothetical protein [Halomonas alkalisoli]|uniref:hypothetical protein n=1 Tax=Halomonas alkalisoli TaxID=2907158 RepID=UPI001F351565|nr:hypothetical protein [Halomonas alkalisoli]MCE9682659.1 hypothetical protein [Halomonas alkalisoli]
MSTKDKIAIYLYPPLMILLVAWSMVTMILAAVVVYHQIRGIIEPSWFLTIVPMIEIFGTILKPSESDASRALDAVSLTVLALAMGVFLNRCSQEKISNKEVSLIIFFLLAGVIQLALILVMPKGSEAAAVLYNGQVTVEHLTLILTRNSNIALALFAASIGVQYRK